MEKLFGPNWQTTLAGALGLLGVICTQGYYYLDNDPNTNFNINVVWLALTSAFVAWRARDKQTSDEESGIPPYRTGQEGFANYQRKNPDDTSNYTQV